MEAEIQRIKQRFGIIGNSKVLNRAIEIAIQVSSTPMNVLITGENGTGKESFSKIIHSLSPRKSKKLIAVNCGAIPEGTIDSELFGHEKGSFTGASEARKGYFETADEGTIFLDEIGEMPLGTQARLLRVLEYGEFIRVGSSKVHKTDVRVVTATNVNLLHAIERGKFREDLYYRLNTVPITVPPLRERGDDIMILFRKFAADFADQYHTKPIRLTQEAQATLMEYRFPGNIRQLKNLADQMSVLEIDRTITQKKLLQYLPQQTSELSTVHPSNNGEQDYVEKELFYKVLIELKKDTHDLKQLLYELVSNDQHSQYLLEKHAKLFKSVDNIVKSAKYPLIDLHNEGDKQYTYKKISDLEEEKGEDESFSIESKEKELIKRALKKHNNKRKNAAQSLGISERTLYRKIKQYGIES